MTDPLLPAVAAFIPRDRVMAIVQETRPFPPTGVALIADISGFTPLTEALTQGLRPDEGAEELTRALGAVFTPLIAEIHAFHGSVIKFGGDALIVWFGRPHRGHRQTTIRRALTAAWRMQQAMAAHGQVPTPIGPVTLRMKIGLAYGRIRRFRLGDAALGYEDALVGDTLDRMAAAEHHAEPGDIVTDAPTLDLLGDAAVVTAWREGFAVVARPRRPARPFPWPPILWPAGPPDALAQRLAPYVPRPVYETLRAGRAQVAELKPVVSLFVQFHGLAYDADPAVGDKLQRYFVTAQQVVARYGGRLNRLITGDKGSLIHVIFGAPRSVEEQEARAVRCALDLQTACGALPFITMQRIGLALGRVFAGPVGSTARHDYTTMGDAINLSARLMQAAAPGQVLLPAAVRRLLGPEFRLRDLGEIRVKGKVEPIHVFAAEAAGERPQPRADRQLPPLFGRQAELAALQAHAARLRGGTGGAVLLEGDVGLGKTLLLAHLRDRTEQTWRQAAIPGTWTAGISLAYGQTFSGYLFISVLRDLLALPPGAGPAQAARRLRALCAELFGAAAVAASYPYLARFMDLPLDAATARRLEGMSGESLRWRLFALLPALFRRLCARQPVIVALDDLQWADPTSLQLVAALLPLTAEAPLLLLLAQRPTAAPLVPLPATAERLRLAELPRETAVSLIRDFAPRLPDDTAGYLVRKSGGNPLFLVELLRTLQAQGALQADGTAVSVDALDLPDSVQGLLLAQIDRLAVAARHTLQLASVIGRSFLHRVLGVLAGGEAAVAARLQELEQAAYVQPDGDSDLGKAHSFRHILIQETAYHTLLYERRRAYHRQVAQTLAQLFPAHVAEQAGLLGYHYEQAGDLDAAITYLLQSADAARLLYAHREAAAQYRHVLDLLAAADAAAGRRERRARTLLKLAQVHANQLAFAEAQDFYEAAFALFAALEAEKAADAETAVADAHFRWPLLDDATPLDPGLVETGELAEVVGNLFEGLVEIDDEWNVLPALARRWQVDEGGQRYRFELRPGLRWSDGAPLTAHDVVFAWRRNLAPETGAGMAFQLHPVAGAEAFHAGETADPASLGIRALDDTRLEIRLAQPTPYFPYVLADPVTFPLPAHAMRGGAWRQPPGVVSSGPFRLDAAARPRRLLRNPAYGGLAAGNVAAVRLPPLAPTLENYAAGHIDWCRIDDQADVPRRFPREAYRVQHLSTFILGFACGVGPFAAADVRRAFALCIDREALVASVWAGVQRPAAGGVVPHGMSGHSPEIGLPFDPARAAALLNAAGFRRDARLTLAALPGFGETPAYLQRAWQEHLGVEVALEVDVAPHAALERLARGELHMVLLGFGLSRPDPSDILGSLGHSRGPLNYFGWQSARYDRLLDEAARAAAQDARLALFREADRLLVAEETAVVPLYHLQAHALLRERFTPGGEGRILRGGAMKFKNLVVRV